MRKSNNYFKFLEYVTYGKCHDNTIDKGNGVLECKSYVSISDIEYRYNTTFGIENDWLTFKNILINEDTLYVYYLEGENSKLVAVYLLDNFKTQKELKDSITTACVEFLYEVLLEKSDVREEAEETEEPEETEKHYADYTSEDFIKAGIENAECSSSNDVFKGCKTVKEVMEVKQELNARFGKEQYFDTDTLHSNKAISNPNWHHVSLRTLANIDNDMLDEKRRNYIFLYNLIKDFRKYAFEIKREDIYFDLVSNVLRNIQQLYFNNVISHKAYKYAARHVQVVSVEKGYFMSEREETFGFKESRRYNRTLR